MLRLVRLAKIQSTFEMNSLAERQVTLLRGRSTGLAEFLGTTVIEMHLHTDFVSGHRELADRTGAKIVFGAKAGTTFPHIDVHDGDELKVGNVLLRILETPGHTAEGISVP